MGPCIAIAVDANIYIDTDMWSCYTSTSDSEIFLFPIDLVNYLFDKCFIWCIILTL